MVKRDGGEFRGRLVEPAVGAQPVNGLAGTVGEVYSWRERGREVDAGLARGAVMVAVEGTTTRRKDTVPGMEAFQNAFGRARKPSVGGRGLPLAEFLSAAPDVWLRG